MQKSNLIMLSDWLTVGYRNKTCTIDSGLENVHLILDWTAECTNLHCFLELSSLVDLHASLIDLHANLIYLHGSLTDLHASLTDLHASLVDLHASLVDLHASLIDLATC